MLRYTTSPSLAQLCSPRLLCSARPGDAIVQDPDNTKDTYRVEKVAFACTYEVIRESQDRSKGFNEVIEQSAGYGGKSESRAAGDEATQKRSGDDGPIFHCSKSLIP